jgi:hypothetical protein
MSFEYMVWLRCQVPHSNTDAFHLAFSVEVAHDTNKANEYLADDEGT